MFEMSLLGAAAQNPYRKTKKIRFDIAGYCNFLSAQQNNSDDCRKLLTATAKRINIQNAHYFEQFSLEENRELISELVAYTLFEWPVNRSTELGKNKRRVEVKSLITLTDCSFIGYFMIY